MNERMNERINQSINKTKILLYVLGDSKHPGILFCFE